MKNQSLPSQASPSSGRSSSPQAIILAAGKGTRMGGNLPKVLYPAADKPMVWWVVQACRQAGVDRCVIVVGYGGEQVRLALESFDDCVFVEQNQQLGTGHATHMAQPAFAKLPPCDVFVLAGDAPLIRSQTLLHLLQVHRAAHAAATLATSLLDDPTGYGRVIRNSDGSFQRIVEQKDASPQQLQVREINPSYYCFRSDLLFQSLGRVDNKNAQGEYYLTDVPGLLKEEGQTIALVDAVPPEDVLGVNNPQQLAVVDKILRTRLSSTNSQPMEGAA